MHNIFGVILDFKGFQFVEEYSSIFDTDANARSRSPTVTIHWQFVLQHEIGRVSSFALGRVHLIFLRVNNEFDEFILTRDLSIDVTVCAYCTRVSDDYRFFLTKLLIVSLDIVPAPLPNPSPSKYPKHHYLR